MQSLLRLVNVVVGPVLTLLLSSRLAGITIAGKEAGSILAGVAAGCIVLIVELALTRGPKWSPALRRAKRSPHPARGIGTRVASRLLGFETLGPSSCRCVAKAPFLTSERPIGSGSISVA